MEQDKRYQSDKQIPESLMQAAPASKFNIRDDFREGRAAYLDMSATTPLDPRVFDAMAPYMVRTCTDFSQQLFSKNYKAPYLWKKLFVKIPYYKIPIFFINLIFSFFFFFLHNIDFLKKT